ncbi:unnamed protein product [Candidula unifasciata]|uniref:Uncharacterized protein n=1 Tax=Candidula unifasciata TaxID=100452 RepID=A0A8S3YLX5_9EUPU|nr:unnamed protein product [Candidula unifasciata]
MKPRKRETGAQLLARLSSRIDLSSIDSDVFSKVPASSSSVSSASKIIEIYGAEGVGKTEMILHYIAKACLPSNWNGLSLPGLGAKVIFIDTEFKFSVFRLAIVLEKQILAILETLKLDNKNDFSMMRNTASSSLVGSSVAEGTDSKVGTLGLKENAVGDSEVSDKCTHEPAASKGGNIVMDCGRESVDAANKFDQPPASHTAECHGGITLEQSQSEKHTLLTAQEIEDLVQEALGECRVQVLRVVSSDQLFISLLALEHMLSHDPLLSLIVIDTVSAFYWSDKLGDLDNPGCIQSKMSPIANIISKYVSDFGVIFLVTKSALVNRKQDWVDQRDKYQSGCASSSTDDQSLKSGVGRSEIILSEHVEFLGKSWLQLGKKRLVLTRSVDRVGRVTRAVACTDWPGVKEFSCSDDGFQFS